MREALAHLGKRVMLGHLAFGKYVETTSNTAKQSAFLQQLGAYANPFFSRALFLQEWRYSPLMPITLPSRDLKVPWTRMVQEVLRPDVEAKTMPMRFCYCGCRYAFTQNWFRPKQEPQSLPTLEDATSYFMDERSRDPI